MVDMIQWYHKESPCQNLTKVGSDLKHLIYLVLYLLTPCGLCLPHLTHTYKKSKHLHYVLANLKF